MLERPSSGRSRARPAGSALPLLKLSFAGAAVLAISMAAYFRSPLLPAIGRDLSMPATELGLATTLFGLGRLLADIPAGRLSDRLTLSHMTAGAGILMAAGAFTMAGAPTPLTAMVGFFLTGAASATMNTAGMTFFSSSVPASHRGKAMGAVSASLLGGQALGPTAGGLLGDLSGWRASMGTAGLIGVAAAFGGIIGLRHVGPSAAPAPRDPLVRPPTDQFQPLSGAQRAAVNAVPFAIFFMLGAIAQTLVPIIGGADLGLSSSAIGFALGLGGLCRFLGAVVGGVVSDRVSRKAALVPGLAVAGAGVALLGGPLSFTSWLAAIVLMSISSYGVAVAATVLADRSSRSEVGKALGSFRVYGDFGIMVGPIAATVVLEQFGRPAAALAVSSVLFTVAIAGALVLTGSSPAQSAID